MERPASGPLVVPASSEQTGQVRLSVIVPTYNEAKNVLGMARGLTDALEGPLEGSFEIVFVDDDSPDGTWREAEAAAARFPRLRVLRRVGERGLSTAVIRGWQVARADVLAVIDGDLQHPPEVMAELWRAIGRGADLAVASRHVAGGGVSDWALHRRLVSRGAQLLGLAVLPDVMGRVSDPMSGYFMVRRAAIAGVELAPLGYKLLVEILARADIRAIGEVGYVFRERAVGGSKASLRVYADYLRHLVRLRALATGSSSRPNRRG
ncbi:MAG: polyprenol monophosphomannose synthase [Polyangiaceae bacterium]